MVCEGERTEPDYILGLDRWLRNAAVEVVIPPRHGVPQTLVRFACQRKAEAEQEARRTRDSFVAYDEVWCVFDVDAHPDLANAREMARTKDVKTAISNPCFELWLLLHFRESPGMRSREWVQRDLRRFLKDYGKRLNFRDFESGLADATDRARRLAEDAASMEEPDRNPGSGVFRLVEALRRGGTPSAGRRG